MTYQEIYDLRGRYDPYPHYKNPTTSIVTDDELPEELRFGKDQYIIFTTDNYDEKADTFSLIDLDSPENIWTQPYRGNIRYRIKVGIIWVSRMVIISERNNKIESLL